MWEARNDTVIAWEGETGIAARKTEMKRKEWRWDAAVLSLPLW